MGKEEIAYTYDVSPADVLAGLEDFLAEGPWKVISREDGMMPYSREVAFSESVSVGRRQPVRVELSCIPMPSDGYVGVTIQASVGGWGGSQKAYLKERIEEINQRLAFRVAQRSSGESEAPVLPEASWPSDPEAAAFDADWKRQLERFGAITGRQGLTLEPLHPELKVPLAPHAGMGRTFSDWRKLPVAYARAGFLFDEFYELVGHVLSRSETANYLVAVRQPHRAILLLQEASPAETITPEYCTATANALLAQTRSQEALVWAQRAIDVDSDSARNQLLLADALHMSNRHEEAHVIYDRLMASYTNTDPDAGISEMFRDLFARATGVVPSPVLAFSLGEGLADPEQATAFFDLAETEFYESPYFRMRHAYRLLAMGNMQRGLAKLTGLVSEMPYLKEPSLNLMRLLEQYDPAGRTLFPELRAKVQNEIVKNGWTTEGMNEYRVDLGGPTPP
jgi:tetratricopeptide (TPR) repeat protein